MTGVAETVNDPFSSRLLVVEPNGVVIFIRRLDAVTESSKCSCGNVLGLIDNPVKPRTFNPFPEVISLVSGIGFPAASTILAVLARIRFFPVKLIMSSSLR